MARFVWVALGSAILGAIGVLGSLAFGLSPITREAWLETRGLEAITVSLILGGCIAGITIVSTRFVVRRYDWARSLHGSLRPITRGQSDGALVWMAIMSGLGEELFFRGWLAPMLGVVLSSLAFGALHQVPRSPAEHLVPNNRWAWAAWAAALGAALAVVYALTGHLLGPVVAHVAINAANLRFLRDTPLQGEAGRKLGGLYDRRI